MLLEGIDLDGMFQSVSESSKIVYKDPMLPPYGRPERSTETQRKAWKFLKERTGTGPLISMIGGKGSGKTKWGSFFAAHQGQMYPESLGCIISNTYTQAKDNAGAHFLDTMRDLGYEVEFYDKKKIKGRPYSSVFVVTLVPGRYFYVLLRSFESIKKLEGIELDWLWVEEIQDADKDAFRIVFSRVRGKGADKAVFVAGMPEDELHWQYSFLPELGFALEPDFDPAKHNGIMYWPSLRENIHNVGEDYLDRMRKSHDGELAERYIEGRPGSLKGNRVLYNYDDWRHRKGRMSLLLSHYDPTLPLLFSFDFNVAPMSVTVWQEKRWADAWDGPNVRIDYEEVEETSRETGKTYKIRRPTAYYRVERDGNDEILVPIKSLTEIAEPHRTVLAQVDEFEVWEGGTSGVMDAIMAKYGNHHSGITVVGDRQGNNRVTSSDTTDWDIIARALAPLSNVTIIRGLNQSSDLKTGKIKYSNPSRRNTINILNRFLKDGEGRAHICFLTDSRYKSGGAAKSAALIKNRPDGNIDDSGDRKDGREEVRTHFFDTIRYAATWFNGGEELMTRESFESFAESYSRSVRLDTGISRDVGAFGF